MALVVGCQDLGSLPEVPPPPDAGPEGILYDVAGVAGQSGYSGDGGNALEALFSYPQDVTVAPSGEVYIVDCMNNCIRLVRTDGTVTRYIGSGNPGDGTSGRADQVDIDQPVSFTIGPTGDFWIAAWNNSKVKRVDPTTMMVSVPVGTTQGFSGDGGPANQSQLDHPNGIVFGLDGNNSIYIADQTNQRIREVDSDMNIRTFVGSGVKGFADGPSDQAEFSFPTGSNAVPGGRISWSHHPYSLLVADTENHRIRFVLLETREVFTIAGTGEPGYAGDDWRAREAQLNYPTDVVQSEDHEVFIADSRNHVVRMINAVAHIVTVAGTGVPGFSPDGTPAKEAMLNTPSGIYFDEPNRTLYIADTGNHQVKKVKIPR